MQLSAVDLNLLPVLHAVLEAGSVKGAARRLGRSPSATSHALTRLRELLGDELLVRAGRSMRCTPRAERLRPRVQAMVDELGSVLRHEERLEPTRLRRAFTIAAGDLADLVLVAPLGQQLACLAPAVDLWGVRVEPDLITQLRDGRCDLMVNVMGELPDDIRVEPLVESHLVCLLRADHPAARGRLTLRRYAALDHVLVAPRGSPRGIVDEELAERGLARRVARTVSSFMVAPHLLTGTDYVLTISHLLADRIVGSLGLVRRKPPLPLPRFTLSMGWHRRLDGDPAHAWLRAQVRDQAAALTRAS